MEQNQTEYSVEKEVLFCQYDTHIFCDQRNGINQTHTLSRILLLHICHALSDE